ncbi:hypothetical protein [Burkholderia sp. AU16741]|uniref:hypothetical protein n=1 Tax=Burkholderia sp. AU16741 TaxID=2015347 RepID=UPI0015C5B195|nr:hypothetical protein [Burkholderia sp. AU16741]
MYRFLFEGDRIDGNYWVCVILCDAIELMQKKSILYGQWSVRKAAKAIRGGDLVVWIFTSPIREGNCLLIDELELIGAEWGVGRNGF